MSESNRNVPGTNSPSADGPTKNPMGETGQSEPISDSKQRGDQFGEKPAENIESGQGGADVSKAAESVKDTASSYASK